MQTLRKRTNSSKHKYDLTHFLGDGLQYKAKLIGVLEVTDARGDRMCQEALGDLKMAIRVAGEHKQRIVVSIGINGVRLLDEKNGDCLYHHPVHKISFIALDPTDPRAFGYIFGCPDSGHRFFGIKTEKTAQVVSNAMRELFDVFLDVRKSQHMDTLMRRNEATSSMVAQNEYTTLNRRTIREEPCLFSAPTADSSANNTTNSKDVQFLDLLDLEVELNSLNKKPLPGTSAPQEDPFGDSFSPTAPALQNSSKPSCIGKLPPPPGKDFVPNENTFIPPQEESWFHLETQSVFDNQLSSTSKSNPQDIKSHAASSDSKFDVFTELDPLGTGRVKPYVDRKYFFFDLKNPQKQALNNLVLKEAGGVANDKNRDGDTGVKFDPLADPFNKIDPFETETSGINFELAFRDLTSFDAPPSSISKSLQEAPSLERKTSVGSPSLQTKREQRRKIRPQCVTEDINSPAMEGVYLRDTPTPDPPNRTITSCSIPFSPLPPKKQSPGFSIKSQPGSTYSDYEYNHDYQNLPPVSSEAPLPHVPARNFKLSAEYDPIYIPQRSINSPLSSFTETEYHLLPDDFNSTNLTNKTSLDITLSQLTKTGFSELATALNMSPSSLSKLTIGELIEYMANLSQKDQISTCDAIKEDVIRKQSNAFEEVDATFDADFKGKFTTELSLYDKYAVFRELVQEKPETNEQADNSQVPSLTHVQETKDRYAALRNLCLDSGESPGVSSYPKDINVEREGYKALEDENKKMYSQLNNVKFQTEVEEKYESTGEEVDADIIFTSFNGDEQNIVSDKEEDSDIGEELRVKEEDEESRDLLDLSRPHSYSENTDSPTNNLKEPQCIIDSTIVEEDLENFSPLEVDTKQEFPDNEGDNESFNDHFTEKLDKNWACFDEVAPEPPLSATIEPASPSSRCTRNNITLHSSKKYKTYKINETEGYRNRKSCRCEGRGRILEAKDGYNGHGSYSDDYEDNDDNDNNHNNDVDDDDDDDDGDDDETDSYEPQSQYYRGSKYYEQKRDMRRKTSLWLKSPRDRSPWKEIEPELPDWEPEDRSKDKVRGVSLSLDGERKDLGKRGMSPWSINTSWEEKERYQTRRKQHEERRRRHERDVTRRERSRKSSKYHRESKESPWDEEYVESDTLSPGANRHWKSFSKRFQESYDSEGNNTICVVRHHGSRHVEPEESMDGCNKNNYDQDRRGRRCSQDNMEHGNYRRKPSGMYTGADLRRERNPVRRKPYSQDELSDCDMDACFSRATQNVQFNKSRSKPSSSSKTSLFEDNFTPSSSGSHFEIPEVKTKKMDGFSSQSTPVLNRGSDSHYSMKTPTFKIKTSPFENDFTPVHKTGSNIGASHCNEDDSVFVDAKANMFLGETADSSLKKSGSINIFKQNDDPFEDDEFFQCIGEGRVDVNQLED